MSSDSSSSGTTQSGLAGAASKETKQAKRARKNAARDAKAETGAKKAKREEGASVSTSVSVSASASVSSPSSAAASAAYLLDNDITIHEDGAPPPCLELRSAPFPDALVSLLCAQGFTAPSAVQASTWPLAVAGRDVLAIAKTGSGKTLGFLLPVLARCYREKTLWKAGKAGKAGGAEGEGPMALIMAPTRELALQIHAEAVKFGKPLGCRAVAVYGGAKKGPQVAALQRGCELIIGTPGRIKDVIDTRGGGRDAACSMERMSMLVLDEADRMLDMGFEQDIRAIVWQAFGTLESWRVEESL